MNPFRRLTAVMLTAVTLTAVALGGAGTALAHEDEIGQGGPFRVRIDAPATLPAGIDARWGNGEVEFHVPAGVEMVGFGADGEAMVKLDVDGNMFANTLSPTWRLNSSPTMTDVDLSGADAEGEPQWAWQQAGGSLMYHEHRIHFMAASVAAEIADGGDVSSFTLAFTVNGERLDIDGALVFDPALDPDAAAALVAAGAAGMGADTSEGGHDKAGGAHHDGAHVEEHDSGSGSVPLPMLIVAFVILVVAPGLVVLYRRQR